MAIVVRPHLVRPTHTGSARNTQREVFRDARPPSHQRLPNAAVSLEPPPLDRPTRLARRARHPLALSKGRQALALRQTENQPMEVLVRRATGQATWQPVAQVLTPAQVRAWVLKGF